MRVHVHARVFNPHNCFSGHICQQHMRTHTQHSMGGLDRVTIDMTAEPTGNPMHTATVVEPSQIPDVEPVDCPVEPEPVSPGCAVEPSEPPPDQCDAVLSESAIVPTQVGAPANYCQRGRVFGRAHAHYLSKSGNCLHLISRLFTMWPLMGKLRESPRMEGG